MNRNWIFTRCPKGTVRCLHSTKKCYFHFKLVEDNRCLLQIFLPLSPCAPAYYYCLCSSGVLNTYHRACICCVTRGTDRRLTRCTRLDTTSSLIIILLVCKAPRKRHKKCTHIRTNSINTVVYNDIKILRLFRIVKYIQQCFFLILFFRSVLRTYLV